MYVNGFYDFEEFDTIFFFFFAKHVSLRHTCFRVLDMMTDIKLAGKQHTCSLQPFEYTASIYAISFTQ